MAKKRFIAVLICIVMLSTFLTGCQALQEYAAQILTEETTDADTLPTLPQDTDDDLIPLEVLVDSDEYTAPQISDDGSMILYRHMTDSEDVVIVQNLETGAQTTVIWPYVYGNPYFLWAPDGETVLFFVDDMGDENYGLYTSNINTGDTETIFSGGDYDCYYVSNNPSNENEIYLAVFNFDTEVYDLYLLNYKTAEQTLILENPGNITGFVFDDLGSLRMVTTTDDDAGEHVWLKTADGSSTSFVESEWEEIFSWDYENADTSGIVSFMPDNDRILYFDASISDTSTLCTYDLETGETTEVYNDPDYEIDGVWTDLEMQEVVAVSVYSQTTEWVVLDESFQDDYDALSSVGDVFTIYDSSEDDEYWLVAYISDTEEMDYYAYDMETGETTFLFNARPELEEYDLAEMEPISYTSSDGLTIEGYATFPVGVDKSDLPTVVLVHGGPWSRDTWGYNAEVQFLASRGYLVLQVNYRGSSGYGKEFLRAGDKEWGQLMHQDILDAVEYAIDQEWTDPDRVGVYGASYGGYEALVCAAFSSDVFQCAVDAFGPSSLLTFIDSIPAQWSIAYEELTRYIGDPETEADMLKERSPLYYADDITIPMLIAQGENDVRVTQQESDQMVEALEAAGVPVTYMLFEDTGHGFNSLSSRLEFYSEMETFFAEYLGGKTEE